jgi:hypothetical protein
MSKKQQSLTSYFHVKNTQNENTKKTKRDCFIYDPGNRRAYFAIHPEPTDQFIVKCPTEQLTLYLRPTTETKPDVRISNSISLPILKSNLQKAVRRLEWETAMSSAAAILWHGTTGFVELVRRLGVIYIEDVCLIDHYTVVVWLMMACSKSKEFSPTHLDEWILIQISGDITRTLKVYNEPIEFKAPHTYKSIHDIPVEDDAVRCVYLRSLYGGMKCDIFMLERAVSEIRCEPPSCWEKIEKPVPDELEILSVAIDFHPLPHMLGVIEKETKVSKERVKELIWYVNSGVNLRKHWTIAQHDSHMQDYAHIKVSLEQFVDDYLSAI